jgi:hypothetical protein
MEAHVSTDADDELPQLLGPYENWVFGPAGYKFAQLGLVPTAPFEIAGIAEIKPVKVKDGMPAAILAGGKDDMAPALVVNAKKPGGEHNPKGMVYPTLWLDGLDNNSPSGAQILPCVLMFPARAGRKSGLDDIKSFLLKLRNHTLMGVESLGAKAEFGYRLNGPLPQANFDRVFATAKPRPEPLTQPEDVLLQKIENRTDKTTPPITVVAVIDDGLPFAHPNLKDRGGITRMEFCWLQSASAVPDNGTVLFGREHTRSAIETLARTHGADEDALYKAAGAINMDLAATQPLAHLWSHGAHVLDIAAGHNHNDRLARRSLHMPDGDLDRIRLIGVELPATAVVDTVGFGKDAFILSAFHYIFDRADRIAAMYGLDPRNVPLVINFSFGFTGGPHTGKDRLEEAISHLIKTRQAKGCETRLVMPSGNDFQNALYGEIRANEVDKTKHYAVPWRIQPNDHTPSYLEVWYPENTVDHDFEEPAPPVVRMPSGHEVTFAEPRAATLDAAGNSKQKIWDLTIGSSVVGQVSIDLFRGIQWRLLVVIGPTNAGPLTHEVGLWHIKVDGAALLNAPVTENNAPFLACRIQRDNGTMHPWQGGRQSYFDHPGDRTFGDDGSLRQTDEGAVFVRRFGTLNGLATHDAAIVVGGIVRNSGKAANYSAAGAEDGSGNTVDCAAPSDDSALIPGQRAAGTRAATSSRLVGTSAAAPQVARGIALAFLDGSITSRLADGTRIKGFIADGQPEEPPFAKGSAKVRTPNRLGEGRVLL